MQIDSHRFLHLLIVESHELVEVEVVDVKRVVLDIAHLRNAEIVEFEPTVATLGVGCGALGGCDVAVGAEAEGQRAIIHVGIACHVLHFAVGGQLAVVGVGQHLVGVDERSVVLALQSEECGVEVSEDALCGAARSVAIGSDHHGSLNVIGAVLQSVDGLRDFKLGYAPVPDAESQVAVFALALAVAVHAIPGREPCGAHLVGGSHLLAVHIGVPTCRSST